MAQQQAPPPAPFWTTEQIDLHSDWVGWNDKLSPAERQYTNQLISFFELTDAHIKAAMDNVTKDDWKPKPHQSESSDLINASERAHEKMYNQILEQENKIY